MLGVPRAVPAGESPMPPCVNGPRALFPVHVSNVTIIGRRETAAGMLFRSIKGPLGHTKKIRAGGTEMGEVKLKTRFPGRNSVNAPRKRIAPLLDTPCSIFRKRSSRRLHTRKQGFSLLCPVSTHEALLPSERGLLFFLLRAYWATLGLSRVLC